MTTPTPPPGSWRLTGVLCVFGGFALGGLSGVYALETEVLNEILAFVCGVFVSVGLLGLGFLLWQGPNDETGTWPEGLWALWAKGTAVIGFWLIFLILFRTENEFSWKASSLLATIFGPGFVYFLLRLWRSVSKES